MIGKNTSNVEFFPKWICPYEECSAENDMTNMVRCWKCNEKKPTKEELKEIQASYQEKKEKQDAELTKEKQNLIQIHEDDYDVSSTAIQANHQETDLEFDLDKLEINEDV